MISQIILLKRMKRMIPMKVMILMRRRMMMMVRGYLLILSPQFLKFTLQSLTLDMPIVTARDIGQNLRIERQSVDLAEESHLVIHCYTDSIHVDFCYTFLKLFVVGGGVYCFSRSTINPCITFWLLVILLNKLSEGSYNLVGDRHLIRLLIDKHC